MRLKSKIGIFLGAILLLGALAFLYIHFVFLPVQLKQILESRGTEFLGRRVTIGSVDFHFPEGFTLNGVTVQDKDTPAGESAGHFLRVEETKLHLLIAPLFKQKTVVIPSLTIKNPSVRLIRESARQWNFSDLLAFRRDASQKSGWNFFIKKIVLENGRVDVEDRAVSPEADSPGLSLPVFQESVENIQMEARTGFNKILSFEISAEIPRRQALLKTEGQFAFPQRHLSGTVSLQNLPLAEYLSLVTADSPSRLNRGDLSSAKLEFVFEDQKLEVRGRANLSNALAQTRACPEISGDLFVPHFSFTADLNQRQWQAQGRLHLSSGTIRIKDNQVLQGEMSLLAHSMTFVNQAFTIQGDLTSRKTVYTLEPDKIFKGDLVLSNAFYLREGHDVHLRGDWTVTDADFEIGFGQTAPESGESAKISIPSLKIRGDISTNGSHLIFKDQKLTIESNLDSGETHLTWGEKRSLKGRLHAPRVVVEYADQRAGVDTELLWEEADLRWEGDKQFQGSPQLAVQYRHDPSGEPRHVYAGTVIFSQGRILGLPAVTEIENLKGNLTFSTDQIQTDQLIFMAMGIPLSIQGALRNFNDPQADIQLKTDQLDLAKTLSLFPETREKIKVQLSGQAEVQSRYRGPLLSIPDGELDIRARIHDAAASGGVIPGDITGIEGEIEYGKDQIAWQNLRGIFQKKPFTLNGHYLPGQNPILEIHLESQNFSAQLQAGLGGHLWDVTSLTGHFFDSTFDIRGRVENPGEAHPRLNLVLQAGLKLDNLSPAAAYLEQENFQMKIESLKPAGSVNLQGTLAGPPGDWRRWDLRFKAFSPLCSLGGYPLTDSVLVWEQTRMSLKPLHLTASIYGGKMDLAAEADLSREDIPLRAVGTLENLNLRLLRKDRKLKNQHLAGNLSAVLNLDGPLFVPEELTGKGSLSVTEGVIWEWKLLDDIFGALLLLDQFKSVVFTEGRADFVIADQKIITENARLNDNLVNLKIKGWLDFAKNIQFEISPQFSRAEIEDSDSFRKFPTALFSKITSVTCGGTLEKSKCQSNLSPFKIIGDITDGLGDILKGK